MIGPESKAWRASQGKAQEHNAKKGKAQQLTALL